MRVSLLLSCYTYIIPLVSTKFTIPNEQTVWHMGDRVTVHWNSQWPNSGHDALLVDVLDFWVTTYDNDSYIQHYTSMRDALLGGSYSWTVYAPERYIKDNNLFVFQFKEKRDSHAYDPKSWHYDSTPFAIFPAVKSSSSTGSTSLTTLPSSSLLRSTTATPTSDSTEMASTPTAPTVPEPSSTESVMEFHRIKIANQIAGAVGGSLAGGVAIMLVVYLIRRRCRKTAKHVFISTTEDAMKDDSGTNTTPLMAATGSTRESHMGNDLPEWVPPK